MRINTEVKASIAGLLMLQVLTSFGAIALLGRLGPAIAQILEENVYSIRAVESMQHALASQGTGAPEAERLETFSDALTRAQNNVTAEGESTHLDAISRTYRAGIAGDEEALAQTLSHLDALSALNHEIMEQSDERAQRLAWTGSWAAVILALLSFGVSTILVRRLTRRVVLPLIELHDAVTKHGAGNAQRRAALLDAPAEVTELTGAVNALLDDHDRQAIQPRPSKLDHDRAVLLHLLDKLDKATVVVDESDQLIAANSRALDLLDGDGGAELRTSLEEAIADPDEHLESPLLEKKEQIEPGLWLVTCVEL